MSERGSLASLSGRLIRAASAALVLKLAALSCSVTMLRANTREFNTGNCAFSELDLPGRTALPHETLSATCRRADRRWIDVADLAGVAVLDGRRLGLDFDLDDPNEFVATRDLRRSFRRVQRSVPVFRRTASALQPDDH